MKKKIHNPKFPLLPSRLIYFFFMPLLKKSFRRKFIRQIAPALPGLVTLGLLWLSLTPKRFFPLAEVTPLLWLGSVYYWTLYRPRLMPYWAVFLIGLAADALTGLPLGISSFAAVIFQIGVASQRRVVTRQTFWTVWFAFMLFSGGHAVLFWMLLSTSYGTLMPIGGALLQWLLMLGCYPPLHMLCNRLYAAHPSQPAVR